MADQDGSQFPSDAAYNDIITRAADTVWRRMVAVGWKPATSTLVMNAAGGVGTFTFPGPVSTVDAVYPCASATSQVPVGPPLRRLKPEQLVDLLLLQAGIQAICYEITQGAATGAGALATLTSSPQITLYPTPASGFYLARYTPQFPGFSADGDVWTGPAGSSELVSLMAAIEGVQKEGDPVDMAGVLRAQLKERFAEVIEGGGFLDAQGQQTVKDVYRSRVFPLDSTDYRVYEALDL